MRRQGTQVYIYFGGWVRFTFWQDFTSMIQMSNGNPTHQRSSLKRLIGFMAFGLLVSAPWTHTTLADEPAEAFIAALRAAGETNFGYLDVALEYLDLHQNDPMIDRAYREQMPLVRVSVLLDKISRLRDPVQVNKNLDEIESRLTRFIGTAPPLELLARAQGQQARLLMRRAVRLLRQAESDRMTVAKKAELTKQARVYLDQAKTAFLSIRDRLRKEIEAFPPTTNQSERRKLDNLRNQYVQIRLQSPGIIEQLADSYGAGDANYETMLQEATAEYITLFETYNGRAAGIDGAIGAGRSLYKLGQYEKAVGYLLEVIMLPDGLIQNRKKRIAAIVALDCWETMDPYPVYEIQTYLERVVFGLSADDQKSADGIRLQIALAESYHFESEEIRAVGPSSAEERQTMNQRDKKATQLLRPLARVAGAHRQQVLQLLRDWGKSVSSAADPESGPPTTLPEARERGQDLRLEAIDAKLVLTSKRNEPIAEMSAAQQQQHHQEIEEIQENLDSLTHRALEFFRLAVSMATPATSPDELSNLRSLQCDCYVRTEQYLEATIIAEFLVDHYPNNMGTRQASGSLCNAYWALYLEARKISPDSPATPTTENATATFYKDKIKHFSKIIFKRWPGSQQTERAGLLMTLISLEEKRPLLAYEYLKKIPTDSPVFTDTVLKVGIHVWRQYVRENKKQVDRLPLDALADMRDKAETLLQSGVELLTLDRLTPFQAHTILRLVDIYLELGQTEKAIYLLEKAPIAPLDLVKLKHPAGNVQNYRQDTYLTALRAYLSKVKEGDATIHWMGKAERVLEALQVETAQSPDGQKTMAKIYLLLSRELVKQFETLQEPDKKRAFAEALETLVVGLKSNATDPQLRLLCGVMLTDIGRNLQTGELRSKSFRFFEQAAEVFEALLRERQDDSRQQLAIQRGLANAYRGQEDFEQAVQQFTQILSDPKNQNFIDLQVDAASTYQEWGTRSGDPDMLVKAINGSERPDADQPALVWGWKKMAQALRRSDKRALHAQVILAYAECKYEYGALRKENKWQRSALKELESFRLKYPNLGGPPWNSKIETTIQKMKTALGQ